MRKEHLKEGRIVRYIGRQHSYIRTGRKGIIKKDREGEKIFSTNESKVNVDFFGERIPMARGVNEWWVDYSLLELVGSELEEIE
ncbi:MAG: hypothetical protein PHC62_06835 [Candidatus Izemoplasmatales bacterium]|nr:hypothetical protein [Candidatus Izemoplasmatales bacterium]